MNAIRHKLMSLLPALVVLVLIIGLHSGISHPMAMETIGYPSIQATSPHQVSPTSAPGTSHCASDHGWRVQVSVDHFCEGSRGENIWPLVDLVWTSLETTYPPHRPPITT